MSRLLIVLGIQLIVHAASATPRSLASFACARNATRVPGPFPLAACPAQSQFTCCRGGEDRDHALWRAACLTQADDACCSAFMAIRCWQCDGLRGLGLGAGVCVSICDAVWQACGDLMMDWGDGATATPTLCSPSSLLCAPLRHVAADGLATCGLLGVPTAQPDAGVNLALLTAPPDADASTALLQRCFDGRWRPPPAVVSAGAQALAASMLVDSPEQADAGSRTLVSWLLGSARAGDPAPLIALLIAVVGSVSILRAGAGWLRRQPVTGSTHALPREEGNAETIHERLAAAARARLEARMREREREQDGQEQGHVDSDMEG